MVFLLIYHSTFCFANDIRLTTTVVSIGENDIIIAVFGSGVVGTQSIHLQLTMSSGFNSKYIYNEQCHLDLIPSALTINNDTNNRLSAHLQLTMALRMFF